ncbi:MAG: hypothetical protein A2075_04455 [Geobacteraceae bacterium GWC2_58_44]|nr:MAG: hypothetical protein A2075_04455 [Geobacteraceae bacterium GWC2_58_44]HBG04360.1 hypothetical protein [Geobacter sp.]
MECHLGQGDLLRLEGRPKGVVLHCLKGMIWLTKGDGVDHLIEGGRSFELSAGATAVVEALGSAEIRLEIAACKGTGFSRIPLQITSRTA